MATVKISGKDALLQKGDTDWAAVDALTDEEITEAAKQDPDSALPKPEQLTQFRRGRVKAGGENGNS